jgi:ParB family chromosome partitioning protein
MAATRAQRARRCRVQSAAGEAPPRGGAGLGHWVTGSQGYRRCCPVRLMKRDLLIMAGRLTAMLDERKFAVLIRQHGMGKPKEAEVPEKLLAAFLPKAEESILGRILVQTVVLLSMRTEADTARVLREAAQAYKVDTDVIAAKVKQEFAANERAKGAPKPTPKPAAKAKSRPAKKTAAA